MKQARGLALAGICARRPPALATSAQASAAFGCGPPGGLHWSVSVRSGEVPALVWSTSRDPCRAGLALLKNATGMEFARPGCLPVEVWLVLLSVAFGRAGRPMLRPGPRGAVAFGAVASGLVVSGALVPGAVAPGAVAAGALLAGPAACWAGPCGAAAS